MKTIGGLKHTIFAKIIRIISFLFISTLAGSATAADFWNKTVEVYRTDGIGLKAWTDVCSGTYVNKSDGSRGVAVSGSSTSCGGYKRWAIQWPGEDNPRWSAEDWLRVIPPDLKITGSVDVSPSICVAGETLTVKCKIENVGEGRARASGTKVQLLRVQPFSIVQTDDYLETDEIESDSSEKFSHEMSLPSGLSAGFYRISVEADTSNSIGQSNFGNDVKNSDDFYVYASQYIVTATAGSGGTISPSGVQTVEANGDITFTATPNTTNTVDTWTVDGNIGQIGGTSFVLNSILTNKTVNVSFTPKTSSLNVQIIGSGAFTVQPTGAEFVPGTKITLTAIPGNGFQFSEWYGAHSGRSPSLSFIKGVGNEKITVRFLPLIVPESIQVSTAHSTPSTIGIDATTHSLWITLFEYSRTLIDPVWNIQTAIAGTTDTTLVELPNASEVGFIRVCHFPQVNTPPFLDFPIHTNKATPQTAPVSAVFDHSADLRLVQIGYEKDHMIRATSGFTLPVLKAHQTNDENYAIMPHGTGLPSWINYQGVINQGGSTNLQYDGHPGYDYKYSDTNVEVFAAADGEIVTEGIASDCSARGLQVAAYYMKHYHALIIRHENDYCTVYMHLSEINSNYADTSDVNYWKPKSGVIKRGDRIGRIGNWLTDNNDTRKGLPVHFHFEVWRKEGREWYFADPYGFRTSEDDPTIITPYLWVELF